MRAWEEKECTFAPSLAPSAAVSNFVLQRGGRSPIRRAFPSQPRAGPAPTRITLTHGAACAALHWLVLRVQGSVSLWGSC